VVPLPLLREGGRAQRGNEKGPEVSLRPFENQ
jgi:hypothetical protein